MKSQREESAAPVLFTKSFLSRALTRRGASGYDEVTAPKGPLGLTTLHDPGPEHAAVADIVFVHGLNGGSHSTWSKGSKSSHFWPGTWLPLDNAFHDVRIHTFGYPSAIGTSSILNVHDFARSLLGAVKDAPSMNRGAPPRLIFVAHSMGGLVVKKAYIIGHHEPEFQPIVDRVASIVFLGTPHQGAAIAQTAARLAALMGGRPFIDDLLPQSPMLQSINEEFPRLAHKIQLMSFYETRPMNIGPVKAMIVEKTSAVMNLPNERRTLLDANHRHVAMFNSPSDPAFITVRNALATIVSSHRDTALIRRRNVAQQDLATLERYLGIANASEDDIMAQDALRTPGSCEWLTGKDWYQSWKQSLDSSLLWLRGRPGQGKSVLAGHIVNDMRTTKKDCCFYFFQKSDRTKSNTSVFLRSMALQMAMLHPEILSRLQELSSWENNSPINQFDSIATWGKVYFSAILKIRLHRPQFWIIDSLDECENSREVMGFLTRMQEQWPLSVLITSRDLVEAHMSRMGSRIEVIRQTISVKDSMGDISLLLESNLSLLPCPSSEKWPTGTEIASQIAQNSGGSFLWASLICSELRDVTSEREMEAVLESVPSNMDALYSKLLNDMAKLRFGKDLAKAIITWTTYAFRPMSTFELQAPIELDLDDRIDVFERAIAKCCGNVIHVDAHNKVQLIHSTAREFLTDGRLNSEFIVSKVEGHRRLAKVCLEFFITGSTPILGRFKPGSSSPPMAFQEHPFTAYASIYVFQHVNMLPTADEDILRLLSQFFTDGTVLRWVEVNATRGNLHAVFQAGKTIGALVDQTTHSTPIALAEDKERLKILKRWGNDLIHIVTKFAGQLQSSPKSIHRLIPPFCPPDSAIRQQFSHPYRGLKILGLSTRGWDDCLTTISYPQGMRPNAIAVGLGFFAVGMMNVHGDLKVYGDSIFDEMYSLSHGEPVWCLAFAGSGQYLASAGGNSLKIWTTADGQQITNLEISSLCLAMQFSEEDTILRVATRKNQLIEFDMFGQTLLHGEPATWTTDLEERMQSRSPTTIALGSATSLLSVIYQGENIVLWDYLENRIHDIYEKETGSIAAYGSHNLAEGVTTVASISFSHAIGTSLLAAAYTDGDLVVYDTTSGEAIAAVEGANINLIASAPNGRTLAGVDSHGNLTLFDFETLRPLSRIRLDAPIAPKALALTFDNSRLIEIRGQQCRVWQPTVLPRADYKDEKRSDTIIASAMSQELEHHTRKDVEITAITCCKMSGAVFYATIEGCVYACDIPANGEPLFQQIFVQNRDCPISILHFDQEASVLTCCDRSSLVTSRKVLRRNVSRQQISWDAGCPFMEIKAAEHGRDTLRGVILSGKHSRLLLSYENLDTLSAFSNEVVTSRPRLEADRESQWLSHPSQAECILRISKSHFEVYSWSDLRLLSTVSMAAEVSFDRLVSLHHTPYIATVSMAPQSHGPAGPHSHGPFSAVQIWDSRDLDPVSSSPMPVHQLDGDVAEQIELVIGGFGARMIVYTTDHWIASVDLHAPENGAPLGESLVRHFFMPNDWVAVGHRQLLFGIGRSGEIVFAKQSELAVIRRGLEITDSGGSFNPRRGRVGIGYRS
ncbi:hypothetical protein M406DRAFT_290452 [Cryphonectria parasitica EP155]|uniref:GPI inositol-deacylase n=1 Tax=Cryphonectria parasitica (strain ATCC 38755 / EP155) TaxID=660469 RepID=A0A9P5CPF6_CRYP1|nr:uncharacterized protein M406DRAFT_290452 [Cryphonectria parasitica EP155]KAF3766098.1 hypothetical protein M406DRAFT_290452 [Cryphonectria parasitica EP155]